MQLADAEVRARGDELRESRLEASREEASALRAALERTETEQAAESRRRPSEMCGGTWGLR